MRTLQETFDMVLCLGVYSPNAETRGLYNAQGMCSALWRTRKEGYITENECRRATDAIRKYLQWLIKASNYPNSPYSVYAYQVLTWYADRKLVAAPAGVLPSLYLNWAKRPRSVRAAKKLLFRDLWINTGFSEAPQRAWIDFITEKITARDA